MGDALFRTGEVLAAILCVGTIGMGATVLLAFIIGECQRIGEKRWLQKRVMLQADFQRYKDQEREEYFARLEDELKGMNR